MKSKANDHVVLSAIIALVCTSFFVIHKKIGGTLTGGVYSEPHAWSELLERIPSFILIYIFAFLAILLYFRLYFPRQPEKTLKDNSKSPNRSVKGGAANSWWLESCSLGEPLFPSFGFKKWMEHIATLVLVALIFLGIQGCMSMAQKQQMFRDEMNNYVGRVVSNIPVPEPTRIIPIENIKTEYLIEFKNTGCQWIFVVDEITKIIENWHYISDSQNCYLEIGWFDPW